MTRQSNTSDVMQTHHSYQYCCGKVVWQIHQRFIFHSQTRDTMQMSVARPLAGQHNLT